MGLKIKDTIILSKIMDKCDVVIENGTQEEVGLALVSKILTGMHKAEEEVYELVMSLKDCTRAEAMELDVVPIIKDLMKNQEIADFFK